MLRFKNYVRPASLEEAFELNRDRSAAILGGTVWMRLGNRTIDTAIDLSGLGLDTIEETEKEFRIGCMVTLHDLETHKGLNELACGAFAESLSHIVGVQLRNMATVGGTVFGRYGFSDVITLLSVLNTSVELYKGGRVPLQQFLSMKPDRDILVRVIIKKERLRCRYLSQRLTETDFPALTAAAAVCGEEVRVAVGARPAGAALLHDPEHLLNTEGITEEAASAYGAYAAGQLTFGSNRRASAEYRAHLAAVLIKRALLGL